MSTSQPVQAEYDVIIIGAGASGLMCALTAGQRGRKVLVIDHANKVGKKILASGGGRCNFTNIHASPENYLSSNPHFCKSALARYSQWDFQALVDKYQVPWHEKKLGQLFCDHRAVDIVNLLLAECRSAGVSIQLQTSLQQVRNAPEGYRLMTSIGALVCRSLVVATGGLSFPTMGATGLGHALAKQFGHALVTPEPALVPLVFPGRWRAHFSALAGISAEVRVHCNGQGFRENILFTHRGLSGPAILQISSFWQKNDRIFINWLPGFRIDDWLERACQERPKSEFQSVLASVLTRRLAQALCQYAPLEELSSQGRTLMAQFSPTMLRQLALALENWPACPCGTEGYKKAEVTRGGVATDRISSKTFESQLQPGLFFVGEVLDVTGQLGGFNFQWAWSSGYCAGLHV